MAAKSYQKFTFEGALADLRASRNATNAAFSSQDFYAGPSPEELCTLYTRGYQGIRPDLASSEMVRASKEYLASQPKLYDVFPWAKGLGKGKLSVPYLACLHFDKEWGGDEAQTVGSCVSHGCANAASIDYAMDALMGETTYKGRICKENIYRSRGYNTHGWYCAASVDYIGPEGRGGLLFRKVYEGPNGETVDLTKLNEGWSSNGRAGVPNWLEEESAKCKAKWTPVISTIEEYRDALALGFGINVCSSQGFSSETDEFGVATARGSWSHSMAHTACDDTEWAVKKYGALIGGIQQSWGAWNRQRGKPEHVAAMATGMFFSRSNTIASMLRGGDSFAVCGVWGWERTGWEAFDVTSLLEILRSSTMQDYYKARSEKIADYEAFDVSSFLAI